MCRNGKYTERGIKEIDGFMSERWRIEPEYAMKVDPSLGLLGVLLEPTTVVTKAWEQVLTIGRRAFWQPHTVLVTGAGPIGLLAADILVKISATNRGPDAADLHLLPTLWFRNDWSRWIAASNRAAEKPHLEQIEGPAGISTAAASHPLMGTFVLSCDRDVPLLFTENETNHERLFPGQKNESAHVKDGVNDFVVNGRQHAVNPEKQGTKVAAHYEVNVCAGKTETIRLRLSSSVREEKRQPFGKAFDALFDERQREADEFYKAVTPPSLGADAASVMRQALAGMLWSKQFFFFDGDNWLDEHHSNPLHSGFRQTRNWEWFHMLNEDVVSMPDKCEYPWYAAWDLAFHALPLSIADPDFAKSQMKLMLRGSYLHPNGQMPAYEWNFSDVNPPIHAFATLFLHRTEQALRGEVDLEFLTATFNKLLLNFTWWVNRKDRFGKNVFEGGFLGLDNIGTAWMALFRFLSVWQTGAAGQRVSRANAGWRHEFQETLPDLRDDDIAGSGFAITAYDVHDQLGGDAALARLRARLRARGLRLLLDYVPNHTGIDHPWVQAHPESYVEGTHDDLARAPQNYTRLQGAHGDRVFAYGRDPYLDGWPDTLQLNYANPAAQEAMIATLVKIAGQCDGVRCDMAMLVLPDVFERTWGIGAELFWPRATTRVREQAPDFCFMAEVYWDLEWTLQQQGFDYTYDKRLYDRLRDGYAQPVREHFHAGLDYQRKLARFLENHDEPRASVTFAPGMHEAAAVITYLSPGLRFFHEGQLEGRKKRISPHLVRAPLEPIDSPLERFYERLLAVIHNPAVRDGDWRLLECTAAWDGNWTSDGFVAGLWTGATGERRLVAVNYAANQSQMPRSFAAAESR